MQSDELFDWNVRALLDDIERNSIHMILVYNMQIIKYCYTYHLLKVLHFDLIL